MPLMMDDGIDVDDLFGDTAGLDLVQSTIPKGLLLRLEELCLNGCCQYDSFLNR